jgi:hypothetical protein
MKTITNFYCFILASLILCLSFVASANGVDVDAFRVEGLEGFKGRRLSVFYVSARPATLATPGQIAKVRKILKGPFTHVVTADGHVELPAVQVPRDGWTNFSHVIFVVHTQARYALQNVDQTIPEAVDTENAVPFKTEFADFLYRKSIDANELKRSSGVLRLY